jgi:hypothetical protein
MARRYKMRAKDSVTAAVFTWLLTSLDFSGTGYPGPNAATNIQCLGYFDDGAGGGGGSLPFTSAHNASLLRGTIGAGGFDAELSRWGVGATDRYTHGDDTRVASQWFRVKTGGDYSLRVNDVAQFSLDVNTCTILPSLQVGASGGAYAGIGLIRTGTLSANTTLMAVRVAGNDRAIFGYENSGAVVVIGSDSLDTTFRSEARLRLRFGASLDVFDATAAGSVFRIKGAVVADASAAEAYLRAPGSNAGNTAGAIMNIQGGRRAGSGTPGGVALWGHVDDTTLHKGFQVGSSGSAAQIAFFGGTLATQQTDVGALTVSVGTADGTVADVGAAFSQATLNNNFRDLADKINAIRAVLRAYTLTT